MKDVVGVLGALFYAGFFASWGTGVVAAIIAERWLILVACLLLPPAGSAYGVGVWIGAW